MLIAIVFNGGFDELWGSVFVIEVRFLKAYNYGPLV